MRGLMCVALLTHAMFGVVHASEPHSVLVLSSARDRGRDAVLVDALRIYLRDLGRTVRRGGTAPRAGDVQTIEHIAAEARVAGDEVVVWFDERSGGAVLCALRVGTLDLRETPVDADDPLQAARSLALRLRALLAAHADDSAWRSTAPEAAVDPTAPRAPSTVSTPPTAVVETPSPAASPAPVAPAKATAASPPALPTSASTTPPTPPGAAAAPAHAADAPRPRRILVEATASYVALAPTTAAWFRQGLLVRASFPWGRLAAVAFVDTAFTTAPSLKLDGNTIGGRIWPIGLGAAWRLRRPRYQIAVGPRVSLQIADIDAHAQARSASVRRYSAGLGATAEATWRFSRYVGLIGSVSAEALIPRLQFAAGGPATTDLGWAQFGFSLGIVASIP